MGRSVVRRAGSILNESHLTVLCRGMRVREVERAPAETRLDDGTFYDIFGAMTTATRRRHERNLHVPLSDVTYVRLRAEAERLKQPATTLAREAIDRWLAERQRAAVHDAISEYAQAAAGTVDDFDPKLEAAAVEHLLGAGRRARKARRK